MKGRVCPVAAIVLLALTCSPAIAQQQKPPVRSITRLAGDLYRVQNNDHYTLFLVTSGGIILADPINVDAANWLKAELADRFPNAPVRYVFTVTTIRITPPARRPSTRPPSSSPTRTSTPR